MLLFLKCICQQPDNSDFFKGHILVFPGGGGAFGLNYSGALAQVGDKVQRWRGSKVWGHHASDM